MKKKTTKILLSAAMVTLLVQPSAMPAFAAGDVAGAIEQTWTQAQTQIKTVVNNVVFPVVDMILAILFFVKVGTAYFDYRKHGQFEFAAPLHPVRLPDLYPDRSHVHLVDSLMEGGN